MLPLLNGSTLPSLQVQAAFLAAVKATRLLTVQLLVECYGARPDADDSEALVAAASTQRGVSIRLVEYLLQCERAPARADAQRSEALMAAVWQGHEDVCEALLGQPQHAARADDQDGRALELAVQRGNEAVVR